jgi:hypothetical protein
MSFRCSFLAIPTACSSSREWWDLRSTAVHNNASFLSLSACYTIDFDRITLLSGELIIPRNTQRIVVHTEVSFMREIERDEFRYANSKLAQTVSALLYSND